jgi:SAM-dependent methyltransferase
MLGPEDAADYLARRRRLLKLGLDLAHLDGIEIGPLTDPVVAKSEGPVRYVDHADRAALQEKYKNIKIVDISQIVDVDVIWTGEPLLEAIGGGKVDYIIASHVLEHVPDLVTWLADAHDALKPLGQIRFVLPDKRFSFDALREETRLTDILAAWVLRCRRPQVRDILDFQMNYAPTVNGQGIYDGLASLDEFRPKHSFEEAVAEAEYVRDTPDYYRDVHCWAFTPKIFALLMSKLAEFGLLKLACAGMADPVLPVMEFFVFMQPSTDQQEICRSWREAAGRMADPLPGSAAGASLRRAQERQAALEEAERERDVLRLRLAELHRSTSWRVTAPLRWARRLLRL